MSVCRAKDSAYTRTHGGVEICTWTFAQLIVGARISRSDFDYPTPGELRLIYLEDEYVNTEQ
jgi:hypothetical protein